MRSAPTRARKKSLDQNSLIIILLLFLIIAVLGLNMYMLFFRDGSSEILPPDYAPMEEDVNATDIENDTDDKLEVSDGVSAVGISYSDGVKVDLSSRTVTMMFRNPGRSLNNMVLQIIVQDTLLAQSNLLVPGKQLNRLSLKSEAAAKLQPGTYVGKFVVSIFDPDTGERSMVDSQVDIKVTVTE